VPRVCVREDWIRVARAINSREELFMSTSVASPSISSPISTFRPRLWVQTSIAAFISLTIALYFWIDSRYPALLKKLHSGKGIQTKGALSFDALMPVTPAMSLMTRIGHTTVNWMWTNRIGMTFGICFGAAMLTLLATLPVFASRAQRRILCWAP
jgi:C4-dicarboxylate transporter